MLPRKHVLRHSTRRQVFDFEFFRLSISPLHCEPPENAGSCESITINDDLRQAVLLAEGVAHALLGESNRSSALECFRQLQEWPGSPETLPLRQQATYNEAVLWRRSGCYGKCVLMMTELLGETAPDTRGCLAPDDCQMPKSSLPKTISLPARVARLEAFARYSLDDWSTLPVPRILLLTNDAEKLIADLSAERDKTDIQPHDRRLTDYMYIEALRATGHVELMRVRSGFAAQVYDESNRPTGLRSDQIRDEQAKQKLRWAIECMLRCEELAPSCGLFCDLAESFLLLKDFGRAQAYGRHATLQTSPADKSRTPLSDSSNSNLIYERAHYLAAESYLLDSTQTTKDLAYKYANSYHGQVTLDEFKALRNELGIPSVGLATTSIASKSDLAVA